MVRKKEIERRKEKIHLSVVRERRNEKKEQKEKKEEDRKEKRKGKKDGKKCQHIPTTLCISLP